MRFWDSSAIVPLLVEQAASDTARMLINEDPELVVWWGTPLECASAVARLRRDGAIDLARETAVLTLLRELGDEWSEIMPTEQSRNLSLRLLRTHPLRAADALQLAAAMTWAGEPRGAVFVSLDLRLTAAAALEGFTALPRT